MPGITADYVIDPGRYCVCLHVVRPGWDGPGLIVGREGNDLAECEESVGRYNAMPRGERGFGAEPENREYDARVYDRLKHEWVK